MAENSLSDKAQAAGPDPHVKVWRPDEKTDKPSVPAPPVERGGRKDGTEPTRFGDWEKQGRCIDF